jgi:hypothetical protein
MPSKNGNAHDIDISHKLFIIRKLKPAALRKKRNESSSYEMYACSWTACLFTLRATCFYRINPRGPYMGAIRRDLINSYPTGLNEKLADLGRDTA